MNPGRDQSSKLLFNFHLWKKDVMSWVFICFIVSFKACLITTLEYYVFQYSYLQKDGNIFCQDWWRALGSMKVDITLREETGKINSKHSSLRTSINPCKYFRLSTNVCLCTNKIKHELKQLNRWNMMETDETQLKQYCQWPRENTVTLTSVCQLNAVVYRPAIIFGFQNNFLSRLY